MLRQPWFNFGLMIDGDIKNVVRMSESFYRYLSPLEPWGKLDARARKRLWHELGRDDALPHRVEIVVAREAVEEAVDRVLRRQYPERFKD